jgi:hypothetical protein
MLVLQIANPPENGVESGHEHVILRARVDAVQQSLPAACLLTMTSAPASRNVHTLADTSHDYCARVTQHAQSIGVGGASRFVIFDIVVTPEVLRQ